MKRTRKKFTAPTQPTTRLEEERNYIKKYGFRRKKEIWKAESLLRGFKAQAKKLIALRSEQSGREAKQLIERLARLGLINDGARLEDVLALTPESIFERRLQKQILNKRLAKTIKQARQFITHGHIMAGDKKVTVPSYLVLKDEEDKIRFVESSTLSNIEHPERVKEKEEVKTQLAIEKSKENIKEKNAEKTKERVKEKKEKPKRRKKIENG